MTFMTTRPNDVLTTIEPDNEADCAQRFHLEGRSRRCSFRLSRDFRTREYMPKVLPTALRVFVPVFNTHLPFHFWCFVIISSSNMPGKAAEPVYPPKMPDFEKSLGAQASTADNMLSKVELKKPSSDDANSSEVAENKPEKEKEGGIKDYFASGQSEHMRWIELTHRQRIFQYANRLDIFLYVIALTGDVAVDAALPLMTLMFDSSTASFSNFAADQSNAQQFTAQINHLVLYFVYLFVARFVIDYVTTLCICIATIRTTRFLRKMFLKSLLRQKVWHFNKENNESSATQITMSTWSFTTQYSIADRSSQTTIVSIKILSRNCIHSFRASHFSSRNILWHSLFSESLLSLSRT